MVFTTSCIKCGHILFEVRNWKLNKIFAIRSKKFIRFNKVVSFRIVKLKIMLVIEERQIKPLPSFGFHRIDHVLDASTDENSKIGTEIALPNFARVQKMNQMLNGSIAKCH